MSIVAINVNTTGLIGQQIEPRRCTMITTDSIATITTAGYLNSQNEFGNTILPTDIFEVLYSFNVNTQVGTFGIFQVTYSASTGFTLNIWENPGNVLLPVVSGDFAVFNGTTGQIKDAGYSATDAAKTKVVMAGSAVVLNRIAHFVDTAGTIDDTAAAVTNAGDIYAGLSGTAGALRSYPASATTGYLSITGVANSGDFAVLISNASHGQSTTYSISDAGNALGRLLNAAGATPFVSGNFPVASGTGGLMVDSGLAASNIQNKTNIKAATTGNVGGAGAGPISIAVAGMTAASVVVATVEGSSNPVSVIAANATGTGFDVTFSGDPGATCTLNYIAFIAAQ
jgi:hypothetical protein